MERPLLFLEVLQRNGKEGLGVSDEVAFTIKGQ